MPPASLARCFLPHTLLPSPYLHSLHYMHTFTVIRSRLRHGKSVAARPLKNSLTMPVPNLASLRYAAG